MEAKVFLKLSMSVFPKDHEYDHEISLQAKRRCYSDIRDMASLTGSKRLIMLAIVPEVKETHSNMKIIFDLVELNNIPFIFLTDFKLLLITLGKQTATSSYPCPYCNIFHRDISKFNNMKTDQCDLTDLEETTFGKIKSNYEYFEETLHSNHEKGRFSYNTVAKSLIEEEDDVTILQKCPVPEFHVMEGFVNHTFFNGLAKVIGLENAMLYPKHINAVAKDYHGTKFEGNASRKILKEANKLTSRSVLGSIRLLYIL